MESVKIGGHDVLIEYFDGVGNDVGYYVGEINTIKIKNNLKGSFKEQILCHEILHAMFSLSGSQTIAKDIEENIITSLENIFWQFLRDNTDFFDKPSEINT